MKAQIVLLNQIYILQVVVNLCKWSFIYNFVPNMQFDWPTPKLKYSCAEPAVIPQKTAVGGLKNAQN